jgi:glycosyltransferase involved in cell wall biosynthesis
MKESKIKLLVVSPHPVNTVPGQRLKYEQYFEFFRQNNIEVSVEPFISEKFHKIIYTKGNLFKKILWTIYGYYRRFSLLFTLRKYDIVYVFLWVTPFGFPFFEWLYYKISRRMIYDIDDLVYLHYKRRYNSFIKIIKGRRKPIFLMKRAKHVITCTPYLDQFVRQYNQNTTDISSTINSDTYIPVNGYSNEHQLVLGWSGSHSTSKYLYLLTDVLRDVYKEYSFKLIVIGDRKFSIKGLDIEALDWSEKVEIPTLQKMDIGLYPLPLDDEWVLGKSGLKAIQYMMLGIPTIATAIGANFRVIENNDSGFLVKTEEEWKQKLIELINAPELRKKIGLKARERAEKYFSVKANAPLYLSIIEKVISKQ